MTKEEAIGILKDCELNPCVPKDKEAIDIAIQALKQEPKTGHWIEDNQRDLRICSICGRALPLIPRKDYYCPNCGARMESEDKE